MKILIKLVGPTIGTFKNKFYDDKLGTGTILWLQMFPIVKIHFCIHTHTHMKMMFVVLAI